MTVVSQNNRTSFSDHCHGSERQSSAVWTVFHVSEQLNFALWPFPWFREPELRRLNGFHWTDHQHFALCWARALAGHAQVLADLSNPSTERDRLRPRTPVRNCVDHLAAPPTYIHHHELKLDSNKANLTAEGHRLDNLPAPSMPWRPYTNLCFFLAEY